MKLEEAIEKAKITKAEAAKILGVSAGNITTRVKAGSELKVSELLQIETATGCNLLPARGRIQELSKEVVEVPYLQIDGICPESFKNRLVKRIFIDYEIYIKKLKYSPENLRGTKMFGDKMTGGEYPIRNEDVLLVDISSKDIQSSGVYIFTTNDTDIFICGVTKALKGGIKLFFYNSKYPDKYLSEDELKECKFKVIGRVVQNLSFTI